MLGLPSFFCESPPPAARQVSTRQSLRRKIATWGTTVLYLTASLGILEACCSPLVLDAIDGASVGRESIAEIVGKITEKCSGEAVARPCCKRNPGSVCQCSAARRAAGNCCCAGQRSSGAGVRSCCAGRNKPPVQGSHRDQKRNEVPSWTACTCGGAPQSTVTLNADPRLIVQGTSLPDDCHSERIFVRKAAVPPQPVLLPETPPPEAVCA